MLRTASLAFLAVVSSACSRQPNPGPNPQTTQARLAALNAVAAAVPEEDRAWPLYEQVFATIEPIPGDDSFVEWPAKPGDPNWPEAVAYLERVAPQVQQLRDAAAKPGMGLLLAQNPSVPAPTMVDVGLLILAMPPPGFRGAAKLLVSELARAIELGDGERATSDVTTLFRMSEHFAEPGRLTDELIAISIENLTLDRTTRLLMEHPTILSDEQLASIDRRAADFDAKRRMQRVLEQEQILAEDSFDRLFDSRGRLIPEAARFQLGLDPSLNKADTLLALDKVDAAYLKRVATPMWDAAWRDWHPGLDFDSGDWSFLLGNKGSYLRTLMQVKTHREAIRLLIALERHRRQTGEFPAQLSQLEAGGVSIPLDPADGQPLRYRLDSGRPILYSLGPDRIDDGGIPASSEKLLGPHVAWNTTFDEYRQIDPAEAEAIRGDWILFPLEPIRR